MVVLLKPTLRCLQRCSHCYENTERKSVELSFERAIHILKKLQEIFNFRHATLVFHGGEPLLMEYEFYKGIIETLKGSSYNRVSIQTSLPTTEDADRIIYLIGNYSTSFEYPSPLHSKRIPERIMEIYKKTGIKGHVINTLWKKNEDVHGKKVYEFYKSFGLCFRFNYPVCTGNAKANWHYLGVSMEKWLKRIIEIFDNWFLDRTSIYVNPLLTIIEAFLFRTMSVCFFSDSCYTFIIAVDPDGEISQCGRLYNYPYGNILSIDSLEVLKGNTHYRESYMRKYSVRLECGSCNYFYLCKGGCKGNSMIMYGSFLRKDPFCQYYRRLFEHIEGKLDRNYNRAIDWLLNYVKLQRADVSLSTTHL